MRKRVVCLCLAVLLTVLSAATVLAAPETTKPEPEPEAKAQEMPATASPSAEASAEGSAVVSPLPSQSASPTPTPTAAPQPSASSTEERAVTVTLQCAGGGHLEREGAVVEGERLSAAREGKMILTAHPDSGFRFLGAMFGGKVLTETTNEDGTATLEFVPTEDGELEVVFQRLHEVTVVLQGSASIAYSGGGQEGSAVSGDTLVFPEKTQVSFFLQDDKQLHGAEFNGKAVQTTSTASGPQITLNISEAGTLSVRAAQTCQISTILDNCTLLVQDGSSWQKVRDGDNVLSLPGGVSTSFAIRPRPSYVLGTLLVNGDPVQPERNAEGEYVFTVPTSAGSVVITAVCRAVTESIEGVDPKTGVRYKLPGTDGDSDSNITEDSWISVEEVTQGPLFAQAQAQARSYGELLCVYDLTLHNAKGRYEPTVPIAVSIPIPAHAGGKLKVLHEVNHVVTEIPYRSEDVNGVPCVTIFADSFSIYMLVDSIEEALVPAVTDSDSSGGDGPFILWIIIGVIAALVAAGYIYRRHHKQAVH